MGEIADWLEKGGAPERKGVRPQTQRPAPLESKVNGSEKTEGRERESRKGKQLSLTKTSKLNTKLTPAAAQEDARRLNTTPQTPNQSAAAAQPSARRQALVRVPECWSKTGERATAVRQRLPAASSAAAGNRYSLSTATSA